MEVCLIAPAPGVVGAPGHSPRLLAELLAQRHEVTLIHSGEEADLPEPVTGAAFREARAALPEELRPLKFAYEDHRHAAAAMETIRRLYRDRGPDYLEVPDFRAHGLVALQARQAADPLLAETTVALRASPSSELRNLHDGALMQPGNRRLAELEREQLRLADRLLWPGGDCLGLYRRCYRELELPPELRLRPPFSIPAAQPAAAERGDGPLRLLFLGDLSRSSGVVDLVEACRMLPPESWTLTLAGRDTRTATMGQSVRETIEAMSGDDPRLVFEPMPAGKALEDLLAASDLLVEPARVGVTAATAISAMGAGVPVLAAPAGDLGEVVGEGVGGWVAAGAGSHALGRALCRLEADRSELERVRSSGAPRRRAEELTDPERILDAYDELLAQRRRRVAAPAVAAEPPLVTGIVPYYRASEYVAEAVASLLAQTHPRMEVLVVNDGSFEAADAVLGELTADPRVRVVTQLNRGEASARNFGARIASGEFVVMLDSDNLFEPRFVERALEVFAGDHRLGYVTCWLRVIAPDGSDTSAHPGFAPLGNRVLEDRNENWDGDTLAMLPRRAFTELGFEYHPEGSMHSDWQLYRWMRSRGAYGAVVPERLARYRFVGESIIRSYPQDLQDRSWRESGEQEELEEMRQITEAAE
jgi:glycosyltransferase involved in cell wall biosynthesis